MQWMNEYTNIMENVTSSARNVKKSIHGIASNQQKSNTKLAAEDNTSWLHSVK